MMNTNGPAVDLMEALGAQSGAAIQCITLYIPDRDREGRELGTQRKWVLEAIEILSKLNGGATAMPPSEGAWLNEEGRIIGDRPVVVYSYLKDIPQFIAALPIIRELLHRMGRETNQGEVAFEFNNEFYRITTYDEN